MYHSPRHNSHLELLLAPPPHKENVHPGAEAEQGELAAPAAPGADEVAAMGALSCWPMARAMPGAAQTLQKAAPGADTGSAQ